MKYTFRIAVLSDAERFRANARNYLEQYEANSNISFVIQESDNAELFINEYQHQECDAVLLDICQKGLTGLQAAVRIRKLDTEQILILCSDQAVHAVSGYAVPIQDLHPALAKWIREGGLFVLISNLITVFKYLLLQFLPKLFSSLPMVDFGWPGIPMTLFGETFQWNNLGYDVAHGGLPYFCAYMVAMAIGELINFPLQRTVVFRSKGNVAYQGLWYFIAFCVITCIVNSINCIWVAVAGLLVPDFIYNIGTTVLNGGISMVIFFFVNKVIFPEGEAKK